MVLALQGGQPVRNRLLPYARQAVHEADIEAVVAVLRSDWLTTGPAVERFEHAVAEYCGARYAVAFSSGTAALHAAVHAVGIRTGDEVITTPMTFCSTANAVLYEGGTPVFADVAPDTLTLDPLAAEKKLAPHTRAIIAVDYAGHPADYAPLRRLAEQHGLVLIADAAHALGAAYHGKRVGSLADLTTFSFHPVKHITCGEGGMVLTDRADYAQRMRIFRHVGVARNLPQTREQPWYYEVQVLGNNYRLSDVACALGHAQLQHLPKNIERRQRIASRYQRAFNAIPGLQLPVEREHCRSAWHLYPVRINTDLFGASRDTVIRALHAEGIGSTVHYIPVPQHPYYRERFGDVSACIPQACRAFHGLLSLPMFHAMTDTEIGDVIAAVHKVAKWYRTHPTQTPQSTPAGAAAC